MKRTIEPADLADHNKGLEIAAALHLPMIRSGKEAGRYRTTWGTKYPAGLTRTLKAILEDFKP